MTFDRDDYRGDYPADLFEMVDLGKVPDVLRDMTHDPECHPEVASRIRRMLADGHYMLTKFEADGWTHVVDRGGNIVTAVHASRLMESSP